MKVNLKNLLFLVFIFVLFWVPCLDPDLGWHLRYGEQIFKTDGVFRDNRIGYFLTDYKWSLNYSLYQWLIYVLQKYMGLGSLAVLNSVLMVAMLLVIKKIFRLNLMVAVVVSLYMWIISLPVFSLGLRPQILSTVFLVFSYVFLIKRRWWWMIPLSLIWANSHGAFILELILMSFYLGRLIVSKDKDLVKFLVIISLAFGVSLLNPFGVGIYWQAFRHSWYPLNELIAEWLPPNDLGWLMIFFSLISIGAVLSYAVLVSKKKLFKKKDVLFLLLSFLFFLVLAIKARRNLSLFGVASVFLFLTIFKHRIKDVWWTWLAVLLLTVFLVFKKELLSTQIDWSLIENKRNYPVGAVEYLRQNELCQNIYNVYEWGGYLVWKLPEKKFFVDGRMPAWDNIEKKSPYTIYLEIIQAKGGWSDRLISYGTNCLLISKGTFLDLEIRDEKKGWQDIWINVYEDKSSVVYQLRQ